MTIDEMNKKLKELEELKLKRRNQVIQANTHESDQTAILKQIEETLAELKEIKEKARNIIGSQDTDESNKAKQVFEKATQLEVDYSKFVVKEKSSEQTSDQQALLNSISNIAAALKSMDKSFEVSDQKVSNDGSTASFTVSNDAANFKTNVNIDSEKGHVTFKSSDASEKLTTSEQQKYDMANKQAVNAVANGLNNIDSLTFEVHFRELTPHVTQIAQEQPGAVAAKVQQPAAHQEQPATTSTPAKELNTSSNRPVDVEQYKEKGRSILEMLRSSPNNKLTITITGRKNNTNNDEPFDIYSDSLNNVSKLFMGCPTENRSAYKINNVSDLFSSLSPNPLFHEQNALLQRFLHGPESTGQLSPFRDPSNP
ncbi:hypothetical protein L3V86_07430 [Thiotrichales bacterium 19S11-10]|nr:hypothetical protein [Thiotrichales bacterium 19S11-10]